MISAPTPATNDLFNVDESEKLDETASQHFHTTVAKLLYLSLHTRPDISLPVSFLASRVSCSTMSDQHKLTRVLRFLRGTKDHALVITATHHCDVSSGYCIEGYIDAALGSHPDGKGHSGAIVKINGNTVHVRSTKQRIVAKDSTEAELVALSDKLSGVVFVKSFLLSQGIPVKSCTIYQDNQPNISWITSTAEVYLKKFRNKYMRIRRNLVKQAIDNDEFELQYLPTEDMLADILTKPIVGSRFSKLSQDILRNNYY